MTSTERKNKIAKFEELVKLLEEISKAAGLPVSATMQLYAMQQKEEELELLRLINHLDDNV